MNIATATRTSTGHVKMTGAHKWEPIDDMAKPIRMDLMARKIVTDQDLTKALEDHVGSMKLTVEEAGASSIDQLIVALPGIKAAKVVELRAALGRQLEPEQNYTLVELNAVKTSAMARARTGE